MKDSELPRVAVAVVSDVICPWCYIGKRRLERALSIASGTVRADVSWHPFELNPGMPEQGIERQAYRVRKFGSLEQSKLLDDRVARAGLASGIPFALDRIARTPNTFEAHRLIWLAGVAGAQDAVVEALFSAYFIEGLDIGNRDVLRSIARSYGIGIDRADGSGEVRAELQAARDKGIDGVPWFEIGGRPAFTGAQPPELIAAELQRNAYAASL